MSLADEYRRQLAWRDWASALAALPPLAGRTVLDLGCAIGDQAADLVARGARVIGIDANPDLLAVARARDLPGAEFRSGDLRAPLDLPVRADGIWSSFAAAYFPGLETALGRWGHHLAPGGWIALTEIDDLFGHEPLGERARRLLEAYAEEALASGRYDLHMGRKLATHLRRAGFTVIRELTLEDREFSFAGPASPEVLEGWKARLDRMQLLRDSCGPEFASLREEFLGCLAGEEHVSRGRVVCCVATLGRVAWR